jgi:hypothetical protein
VEEALKDGNQVVVADLDASEVLQPGVGAFDFPAFAVSAQLALVFEAAMTVVAAVGSDQLCAALFQPSAQPIGVTSAVCNHTSQTGTGASRATARHLHRTERAFCKPVFGNIRSRRQQVNPSGYCSGKSAIGHPFAGPRECPPDRLDCKPKVDRTHPGAASVQEITERTSSTALRSTTLAAPSEKKLNSHSSSCVSPCLEAEPIYATTSSEI